MLRGRLRLYTYFIGILLCVVSVVSIILLIKCWKYNNRAVYTNGNYRKPLFLIFLVSLGILICAVTTTVREGENFLPRPVIILTYARSGSSFLGQLLGHTSSVFYVYEPLYYLRLKGRYAFLNGTERPRRSDEQEAVDTITSLLKCDLLNLPYQYWYQSYWSHYSEFEDKRYKSFEREEFRTGLKDLKIQCNSSAVVLIKTIRLPYSLVFKLLGVFPNMKIIHLIRDPRPTMWSQRRFIQSVHPISEYSKEFCGIIFADLVASNILSITHAAQIVVLRYESLVSNPVTITRILYNFLGIQFTAEIENFVKNMTSSEFLQHRGVSNFREKSSKMLNVWRTSIDYVFSRIIDKNCNCVYKRLGYLRAPNKRTLRDMSIPLYTNVGAIKPSLMHFYKNGRTDLRHFDVIKTLI